MHSPWSNFVVLHLRLWSGLVWSGLYKPDGSLLSGSGTATLALMERLAGIQFDKVEVALPWFIPAGDTGLDQSSAVQ